MEMELDLERDNDVRRLNKEKLADQLEKRNRERQQQINAKHELNKQNVAENESLDYFQEAFRKHVTMIEDNLLNLKSKTTDRTKLTQEIHKLIEDTQNLQSYLTASTFFLSNYTVKAYQAILNDLQSRIETTKDSLVAKKKFNFRSKVTTVKPVTTVDAATSKQLHTNKSIEIAHQIEWTLQNRNNEEIVLHSDQTNGNDITISTINNCILRIYGHPSSLQLSKLCNCIVLCGPVSRSVFADNCNECKLIFGCQQLRLHASKECDLYMHVTCRAIIEDCNGISVAPYSYNYDNIDVDFTKAGLDLDKNNWENVADFNWLSTDVPSPNWQCIAVDKRVPNWNDYLDEFKQKYLN